MCVHVCVCVVIFLHTCAHALLMTVLHSLGRHAAVSKAMAIQVLRHDQSQNRALVWPFVEDSVLPFYF